MFIKIYSIIISCDLYFFLSNIFQFDHLNLLY